MFVFGHYRAYPNRREGSVAPRWSADNCRRENRNPSCSQERAHGRGRNTPEPPCVATPETSGAIATVEMLERCGRQGTESGRIGPRIPNMSKETCWAFRRQGSWRLLTGKVFARRREKSITRFGNLRRRLQRLTLCERRSTMTMTLHKLFMRRLFSDGLAFRAAACLFALLSLTGLAGGEKPNQLKPQGYVNDFAGVLSEAGKERLSALCL